MLKLNTLDLDFNDWERVSLIWYKVAGCHSRSGLVQVEESPSGNGYHFSFFCRKDCDLCRMVFDDQRRFAADLTNRRPVERDVLWSWKRRWKHGN